MLNTFHNLLDVRKIKLSQTLLEFTSYISYLFSLYIYFFQLINYKNFFYRLCLPIIHIHFLFLL